MKSPSGAPARAIAPGRRTLLLSIIARAATPGERLGAAFRFASAHAADATRSRGHGGDPGDTPPHAADPIETARVATWSRLVTGGAWATLDELLAARGLSPTVARRAMGAVTVADEDVLPPWAGDVLHLFGPARWRTTGIRPFAAGEIADAASLGTLGVATSTPWKLHDTYQPLVAAGAAHLRRARRASAVVVEAGAARQLLAQLARRLAATATQVLEHCLTPADVAAGHPGRVGASVWDTFFGGDRVVLDAWVSTCAEYPVLARALATVFRHWCVATEEVLGRIGHDAAALGAAFAAGRPLGALRSCVADAGDVHDRGRAVAVLTFACGARVVYKPKDLRIAAAYVDLTRWLNARGLRPSLAVRTVLTRGEYAWEEFVANAPCRSAREVRRFYRRIGMQARLLQLLDGTDFTVDNVVAAGAQPALIDLEMLVSPRLPPAIGEAEGSREATWLAWDAPARSGIVTAKIVGEDGRRGAEVGALASPGECVAPFQVRIFQRAPDGLRLENAYPTFPPHRATPVLAGASVEPSSYFDAVSAGYVAMGRFLARHAPSLAAAGTPLEAVRNAPVRFLARDTHVYARLLQASLAPARMRDGVDRELSLERLWRARFPSPRLVDAEVDAIRRLDIPIFTALASARTVYADGAEVARDFFQGCAFQTLEGRVARLAARRPRDDRALIDATLFTRAPDAPAARRSPVESARGDLRARRRSVRAAADPLAAAVAIARAIATAAVRGAGADYAWVGANYAPMADVWSLGVLGDDMFTGTAGLGVVLAELAARADDGGLAAAARGALLPVARRLAAFAADARAPGATLVERPGALFGWAGWLYACARGGSALGDAEVRDAAGAAVVALGADGARAALAATASRGAIADAASGASGALLVLTSESVRAIDGASTLAADAAAALDEVVARGPRVAYPPSAHWADAVPGPVWGPMLARARHRLATPPLDGPSASAPRPAPPITVGDMLARQALGERTPTAVREGGGAEPRLERSTMPRERGRATAARVWLERAELVLGPCRRGPAACGAASTRAAPVSAVEAAGQLVGVIAARRLSFTRSRAGDAYVPSAVVGRAAVAHVLLRIATGGDIPSLRTFE